MAVEDGSSVDACANADGAGGAGLFEGSLLLDTIVQLVLCFFDPPNQENTMLLGIILIIITITITITITRGRG